MISAVLFDMDGTLLDTALDFETAINQLLISEGCEPLTNNSVHSYVTDGSVGIIRAIFNKEPSDPDFSRLQQQLLTNYSLCLAQKTRLFSGLKDSLDLLDRRQIPWGIVTNKPAKYAEPIVAAKTPNCAVLICPDHVEAAKPNPEGLFLAASKLNVEPENCLYIGDHQRDIEAGQAAGMDTVAVGWGYIDHRVEDINEWNATYVIHETSELIPVLTNYL